MIKLDKADIMAILQIHREAQEASMTEDQKAEAIATAILKGIETDKDVDCVECEHRCEKRRCDNRET